MSDNNKQQQESIGYSALPSPPRLTRHAVIIIIITITTITITIIITIIIIIIFYLRIHSYRQ